MLGVAGRPVLVVEPGAHAPDGIGDGLVVLVGGEVHGARSLPARQGAAQPGGATDLPAPGSRRADRPQPPSDFSSVWRWIADMMAAPAAPMNSGRFSAAQSRLAASVAAVPSTSGMT